MKKIEADKWCIQTEAMFNASERKDNALKKYIELTHVIESVISDGYNAGGCFDPFKSDAHNEKERIKRFNKVVHEAVIEINKIMSS